MGNENNTPTKASHEIDVIGLTLKVLKRPKPLIICCVIFLFLGIIVALNSPKSYTTTVVLAPELSSGGLGVNSTLTDMASNFGIDIGSGKGNMDALYPEIYPDIFASTNFVIKLFDVPVITKNNIRKTYYNHIKQDTPTPFWEYPKTWILNKLSKRDNIPSTKGEGKKSYIQLSKTDDAICETIKKSINCNVDKKTSVIDISVTDNDPVVAAIIADTLQHRLQEYITTYRTQKAKNDLLYYDKLYKESKDAYLTAQRAYAAYCDANEDVTLQSFISKRDELENTMQIKFNAFNQYATQVQNAKAKLQEAIPAFTTLQSPSVPLRASSTPRFVTVLIWLFMGIIVDAIWVLVISNYIGKEKR